MLVLGLTGCVAAIVCVTVLMPRESDVTIRATTAAATGTDVPGLVPVAEGTYRYRASGTQMTSTAGLQPVDGGIVQVSAPIGPDHEQETVRTDAAGTAALRLRYAADGIHATRLAFASTAYALEFLPAGPAPVLALPVVAGNKWSWRATSIDGATTVDATFRTARTESVTIAGAAREAVVIDAVFDLHGQVEGRIGQLVWRSLADGQVLRERWSSEGRAGSTVFRADIRSELAPEEAS